MGCHVPSVEDSGVTFSVVGETVAGCVEVAWASVSNCVDVVAGALAAVDVAISVSVVAITSLVT